MENPCAIVARDENGRHTVSLRADIDFRNARVVFEAIRMAAERLRDETVTVDLHELTFIDSSGISALVRAARTLRTEGRRLRLARANGHLVQILRTAGFARFFLFEPEDPVWELPPRWPERDEKIWQHTSFTIPARFSLISHVRAKISELVESVPGGEEHLDVIRLAVGEAASNAVRHGCRGDEALKVSVECSTDGELLVIEISDPGTGFDPSDVPTPLAGELREGGMGIHFMRLTMDEVQYSFHERGTTVRLLKRLLPPMPEMARDAECEPAGAA